jgi:ABC-type transporter Mla subunit MlaD
MSAYVQSLKVLAENVRAEAVRIRQLAAGPAANLDVIAEASDRLMSQLEADVREVRADFDAVMDRGGEGW